MNRSILTTLFALTSCTFALGQSSKPAPDVRTFDLTPAAPPIPALKYEFHYDLATDRLPGNAAPLYQDAILLLGPDGKEKFQKAIEAYENHDATTFNSLANDLDKPSLYQELDLAARRETCDFEAPFAQMGANTLLPHLEPIVHGLGSWIEASALHDIDQGKNDDAIKTLRLGYEMADKVGTEPTVISALVSLHITHNMNDALIALMNRPDAPNLYFALCEVPSRQEIFRHAMYGNRRFLTLNMPNLTKVLAGEELSSDQWGGLLADAMKLNYQFNKDPLKDATAQNISDAKAEYAQRHNISADQVAGVDPVVLLGELYVFRTEILSDDAFKWRGLPYPIALIKEHERAAAMKKAQADQPGNPFLPLLDMSQATTNFARADRQMAALTTIEAIRSYAAANGGKLPQSLDNLTDTPAPADPGTGKPFEYHVENDSAVISSTALGAPLTYTVHIHK
jgi:hypothetical protein